MKAPKGKVRVLKTTSDVVAAVLRKEFPDGLVDPAKLLEIVSNPRHPLHSYIDWSEANAIREYRLRQVEQLIRKARMVVRYGDVERAAPLYVHRPGSHRLYVAVADLRKGTERGLALLDQLRAVRGHVERLSATAIALGYDPGLHESYMQALAVWEEDLLNPLPARRVTTTRKRRIGKAG